MIVDEKKKKKNIALTQSTGNTQNTGITPSKDKAASPVTKTLDDTSKTEYNAEDYLKLMDEAEKADEPSLEYKDAYDMQKAYIEKYLTRDKFDVNADEIYQGYRKQALDDAKRLQRETTAQAAGLTGGYASSYAAELGANAASDYMADIEPQLYEAALSRYRSEGDDLLDKAEVAGTYGDLLYQQSPEYAALLDSLTKEESNGTSTDELSGMMNMKIKINNGTNRTAKNFVEQAIKDGWSDFEIRKRLTGASWKKGGAELTDAEVDYIVNMAGVSRLTNKIVDHNGVKKDAVTAVQDIYNGVEDVDEVIEQALALGLTEDEIYFIIANMQ